MKGGGEQINGREGETATLFGRCPSNSELREFGFAPRHLSRSADCFIWKEGFATFFLLRTILDASHKPNNFVNAGKVCRLVFSAPRSCPARLPNKSLNVRRKQRLCYLACFSYF